MERVILAKRVEGSDHRTDHRAEGVGDEYNIRRSGAQSWSCETGGRAGERALIMAANILAFIQFDDNTPKGEPPFTNEPNVWSLEYDYTLWGCKDYRFIAAKSGLRNETARKPLIPLRGLARAGSPLFQKLVDEPFVGFLTYSEIIRCLEHHESP